jgi:superfamily I DNA/RNA helicase
MNINFSFKEWLLSLAEMAAPSCPECGKPMKLRTRRDGKGQFYGCTNYPQCKGVMGYDPSVEKSTSPSTSPSTSTSTSPSTSPTVYKSPTQDWIYAKIIAAKFLDFEIGVPVAITKLPNNNWKLLNLDNQKIKFISKDEDLSFIESFRDNNNKPIRTNSPSHEDLLQKLSTLHKPTEQKPTAQKPEKKEFKATPEQTAIENKFAQIMKSPSQSHMMISALAGTGKTTTLKNLAEKFGNDKQKWLYLVFNTKNKVEATEKFPKFVDVRTTNGFLGEVLKQNVKFPQTGRLVSLKSSDDSNKKLEKVRVLADSPRFAKLRAKHITEGKFPSGDSFAKNINRLLEDIRYEFKEQVLKLVGLAKSFALDPRDQTNLNKGIEKILSEYDFDTELNDIKERISKYKGRYKDQVQDALESFLGYDFMNHDYKDSIKEGTHWLLQESMPHATDTKHKQHNLGDYRDFNDDLWYAAIHANEINWPHYDVVLADEVQDFNEAQKIMLQKLHDAGAKIVAVGDENQSIYRFRGADTNAFNNIADTLTNLSKDKDVVRTLSKNFRSKKAIIDFSNKETHVKNLQAGKESADDGEVSKYDVNYDDVFQQLNKEKEKGNIKETAFIARTNEPLVHAALKMLSQKIPFIIVGKDIAKDLMRHIGKIINISRLNDQDSIDELQNSISNYLNNEKDKHYGASTKRAYLQELEEVSNAISSAIDQFEDGSGNQTIAQFNKWLNQRLGGFNIEDNTEDLKAFKEKLAKEHPVVLTTSHKSKGLEFERVFVLRYDLFPHKKATRPEDLKQEDNAKYVALTRAKDQLHILNLDGQPGYKKN